MHTMKEFSAKAETQLNERNTRLKNLSEKWNVYLTPVAKAYREKNGAAIPKSKLFNVARTLENTEEWAQRAKSINEATYSDAISFVNYGFEYGPL